MQITFYASERVAMPALRLQMLRQWIKGVAEGYNKRVGELCYQFCNDEEILEANRQYLQHDYYTDIITFDSTEGERISGDMLISLETVASNADLLGGSFGDELHRVIIHGVLHLAGLGDKTDEEARLMREAEDKALNYLKVLLGDRTLLKH